MACYGRQVLGTMCDWYMVSRVFLTLHPLARGRDGVWVWVWVGGRWEGGKASRSSIDRETGHGPTAVIMGSRRRGPKRATKALM